MPSRRVSYEQRLRLLAMSTSLLVPLALQGCLLVVEIEQVAREECTR